VASTSRSCALICLAWAGSAAGFSPSTASRLAPIAAARSPHVAVRMGRAERRMADKEDKQSARNPGSKRETQAGRGREDAVSRTEMLKRLAEVPVFGIALNGRFLTAADGAASFYLDAREAHQMLQKMSDERLCVEGLPLSEVYFDPKTRLKAAYSALRELESLPVTSRLLPNIKVPLFCMDGLQTTDKKTGTASLPMFNSKAELLEFAKMASMDPSKVLATDLSVVVGNMLNGPAGLLRNAKFFADNKAIR